MKLQSNIPPRRDGSHVNVNIGGKTYTGDENGVYDVPEDVAEILLETDNFSEVAEAGKPKKPKKDKPKPTVLVNEDGDKIDLGAMEREQLVEFAMSLGLDLIESELDKDGMIAAVMEAAVKAD